MHKKISQGIYERHIQSKKTTFYLRLRENCYNNNLYKVKSKRSLANNFLNSILVRNFNQFIQEFSV